MVASVDICKIFNYVVFVSASLQIAVKFLEFVNRAGNSMTDPIADMLTRIRNALAVRKTEVQMPTSKLKERIAKLLEAEGWVEHVERIEQRPQSVLLIRLKYEPNGQPRIRHLKRVSSPGLRRYVGTDRLPRVLNNMGIAIVSTSRGVVTNRQARRLGVGGEVLCEIA